VSSSVNYGELIVRRKQPSRREPRLGETGEIGVLHKPVGLDEAMK